MHVSDVGSNTVFSVLPGDAPEDIRLLRDYLAATASHPHQLLYRGKALVSTFAGQDRLFGFSDLREACAFIKDSLHEVAPVSAFSFSTERDSRKRRSTLLLPGTLYPVVFHRPSAIPAYTRYGRLLQCELSHMPLSFACYSRAFTYGGA